MDKSCHSSEDSSPTTTSSNGTISCNNNNLRQLNKLSHKISKPSSLRNKPPPESSFSEAQAQKEKVDETQNQNLQHQPPVYNINKNDFRDVVQKLTGSPAHERLSSPPPPLQHPKPPVPSRLHRIRPPPLAHISTRPPNLLECAVPTSSNFSGFVGPPPPLSPLPPFPSVHAESPVSAYMRTLQNSKQFSGFPPPLAPLVSPRRNNFAPPELQSQLQLPSPAAAPFGCLNSPRSPGQLGFPQLPVSPTVPVPVPSPRWRSL